VNSSAKSSLLREQDCPDSESRTAQLRNRGGLADDETTRLDQMPDIVDFTQVQEVIDPTPQRQARSESARALQMMGTALKPGQRFVRKRLFKPAGEGFSRWRLIGLTASLTEATGSGVEVIEIVELVETKSIGKVTIFRHWVINPDGAECLADFAPRRTDLALRSEFLMRRALTDLHFEAAACC
jgi:hypothetical protein